MTTEVHQTSLTPLMRQYYTIKRDYPDTILLFQVGDFYELFFDDAKQVSAFLGITLTKRGKVNGEPIPLCGVPVHALDHYLVKLIKGGFKVALCDQLEQAVPGKVVERGVTRVLTPGTLTDARLLEEKTASYLCSCFPLGDSWGLLFGELMTAQLYATVVHGESLKNLETELNRFFPDEVVLPATAPAKKLQTLFKQFGYFTTMARREDENDEEMIDSWVATHLKDAARELLSRQESLRLAFHTFYRYIKRTQRSAMEQFKTIQFYDPEDFLILDSATQRNLELIKNSYDGTSKNTLFAHLDHAVTPMGSRMIKKWILRPLIQQEAIEQRLDVVQLLIDDTVFHHETERTFHVIGDIERIVGRIALERATLSDYRTLMQAFEVIPELRASLTAKSQFPLMHVITSHIEDFSSLFQILQASLNTDSSCDSTIKRGFDQRLDELRDLALHSDQKILELERHEQEVTGNQSLKIRYNQIHGYYLEVTKIGARSVPDYFIRQQTLVGKERFTTPTLRVLQEEIMHAKTELTQYEKQVFERVKIEVAAYIPGLRKMVWALSHLDGLLGLSRCAYRYNYARPHFSASRDILIGEGRHPIVESSNSQGHFIPNSTLLSDNASLWIITGPNMGGKSTYLRQVALICLMAQCGSFVPAARADLPILDRIFTRIGSGDHLAEGKSTFLVEMEETAMICTQATERSLVILDEVGRGTSTFDGLAIAQAVVEYLYMVVKARCLFATHYHELTALQDRFSGIKSYYAASKKTPTGIVFLYKIMPGIADGSFGIEVAKLAHIPPNILKRAQEILRELQQQEGFSLSAKTETYHEQAPIMMGALRMEYDELLKQHDQCLNALKQSQKKIALFEAIDCNELSPKQALDVLWRLKEQ